MKILYQIIGLILFIFNYQTTAQPYINFKITTFDSVYRNDIGSIDQFQHLGRYNLSTMNVQEYLTNYIAGYIDIVWDPSENYMIINFENKGNLIFDLKSNQVIDENYDWINILAVLYSPTFNNLYIFTSNEIGDFPIKLSVYNLNTKQITSTTGISSYFDNRAFLNEPKRNLFFSNDEKYIYISTNDTLTFAVQVWIFSLETNTIISKRDLFEFGYPNMYGYDMAFGWKSKCVIVAYNEYSEPVRHMYYNVFDFDLNRSSEFIHRNKGGEYYLLNEGKYLLFIETQRDNINPRYHTGVTEIYDTDTGQLLKTFNLPPNGIVYTFDNYPNNLYYAIDIEKPTRQIYVLKMDSIFNVLDLTSLNPSSAIVNSSGFILTVNGKGFDTVSTVYFNGQPRATTFVSDSVITAEILSSDVTAVGSFPVWVTDRYSISDTLQFSVMQVRINSRISE